MGRSFLLGLRMFFSSWVLGMAATTAKTEKDSQWMHESCVLRIRVWYMLDNGEEFLLDLRMFFSSWVLGMAWPLRQRQKKTVNGCTKAVYSG